MKEKTYKESHFRVQHHFNKKFTGSIEESAGRDDAKYAFSIMPDTSLNACSIKS